MKSLLPLLLCLASHYSLVLRKHHQRLKAQCKSTSWPAALLENTLHTSGEPACPDTFLCRSWSQILNLAACKTKKISDILDSDMKLYYI